MNSPKEGSREVHEGIIVSMVPDICLTPAGGGMIPVPYTIWCRQADAANLANSVRQTDDRSHAVASIVLHCYGDEPGTGGGIYSGTTGAECEPKTWSQTVRAEGRNMVRHDDEWWMNHRNTYGHLIYIKDVTHYQRPQDQQITPQMWGQIQASQGKLQPSEQIAQLTQASAIDPDTDEDGLDVRKSPYRAKKLFLQGLTKTDWIRITFANPCWKYRCGNLLSRYRGGAYGCVGGHHMPADSVSPVPRDAGPAIQMDDADHEQTASYGSSKTAAAYRGLQLHAILNGDFMGANTMDVIDVRGKFNDKYVDAMGQMANYLLCLKRNNLIR